MQLIACRKQKTEKHRNTKKDRKIKYTHKNYNSNIPTQKNGKTAKEAQLKKDPANTLKILQAFKIIICYVAFYPSETAVVKIVSLFLEENWVVVEKSSIFNKHLFKNLLCKRTNIFILQMN